MPNLTYFSETAESELLIDHIILVNIKLGHDKEAGDSYEKP